MSYIGRKLQSEDFNVQTKGQLPEVHMFEHHAELARKRGEKQIQLADGNIKNEYKKRIADTKVMKERVQHQLSALRMEKNAMTTARIQLVELMNDFQRPLKLQLDWMEIRSSAGASAVATSIESSYNTVEAALQQNNHELRSGIATLAKMLNEVDAAEAEVNAAERRYLNDIESKTATMVLDKACMNEVIDPPTAVMAHGGPPMQRSLMQQKGLHTEREWHNLTNVTLSGGVAAAERSAGLRKRVVATVKSYRDAGKTLRPVGVVDALNNAIRQNTHATTSLRMNAKMIVGEIGSLEKQHAMLNGSLEKVQQQLHTAKQRLQLRSIRPPEEQVRAGVEEVLEVEAINMKNTEANLMKEVNELIAKRARLMQLLEKVNKEVADNERILAVDKKCAAASMPSVSARYAPAPPPLSSMPPIGSPRAPGSDRGSARGSARGSSRGSARSTTPRRRSITPRRK